MIDSTEAAETIRAVLNTAIDFCKDERDAYNKNQTSEKANCTALIKRYIMNLDILAERFGFTSVSDAEVSKLKKTMIYASVWDKGAQKAEFKTGWSFTKYGLTFTSYKKGHKQYAVLVPSFGLEAATATTQKEITTMITEELANKIKDIIIQDSKSENSRALIFSQMIEAAGYEVDELHKPANLDDAPAEAPTTAPEPQEQPQKDEPIQTTTTTTNKPIRTLYNALRFYKALDADTQNRTETAYKNIPKRHWMQYNKNIAIYQRAAPPGTGRKLRNNDYIDTS